MDFRIALEIYRGPLQLLLYLVRKHELQASDIPIASITDQYLEYITALEKIDPDAVGDFLEMASTLMEIKSRMMLPQADEEEVRIAEDPRQHLVQQLLEYKKYKDAATILEDRSRRWQETFERVSNDLPPRPCNPADQPIHEVELWDLVSALGRVTREHEKAQPSNIVYDDIPIHVHMQRLHEGLRESAELKISDAFEPGMRKSSLIGVFLAVLELVRHHNVEAEQDDMSDEIWLRRGQGFREAVDWSAYQSDFSTAAELEAQV